MLTVANNCTTTLPGCLDATFGGTGVVLTDTTGGADYHIDGDQGITPLLQPDGKIVVIGYSGCSPGNTGYSCPFTTETDFAVIRYNTDGSLDTSFGSGGIVRDAMTTGDDRRGSSSCAFVQNYSTVRSSD